jgi:cardiolipin synthase
MTLANKLTLLRIAGAPLILIFLLKGAFRAAFWLYAATALTDAVDGLVARHLKQETPLGFLLDPLADKFLMVTVYPGLVLAGRLELWVLAVFICRDLIVSAGWALTFILLGDSTPHTRLSGKLSTAAQMALAILLLFDAAYPVSVGLMILSTKLVLYAAVALTSVSMLDYLIVGSRRFGP